MNNKLGKLISLRGGKSEKGYTLLEYCAGAAIIASVLWAALSALGGNVSQLLGAVGGWATARASEVSSSN